MAKGRRTNRKGRSQRQAPFVKLDHAMLRTEAWKHLSPTGAKLLLAIWIRHNGRNNGRISFSRREAMTTLGCGEHKVKEVLEELQNKGFLEIRRDAAFGKGDHKAREWAITAEPEGSDKPTRRFRYWSRKRGLPPKI